MTMAMTKEMLTKILRYARLSAEETRTGQAMHAEEKKQLEVGIGLTPEQIVEIAFAVAARQSHS